MKRSRKLGIGLGVLLGLLLMLAFSTPKPETHSNRRIISAPKDMCWALIADVANYHQYATGLDHVSVLSGEGIGMVRACSDEQGSWQETCTAWTEGESYTFNVDVDSGFPYPFKLMEGTWQVEEFEVGFTEVTVTFHYQFPYRWMKWLFSKETHRAFEAGNKTLIDNWENQLMSGPLPITAPDNLNH